jgi:hypothetical protein
MHRMLIQLLIRAEPNPMQRQITDNNMMIVPTRARLR